MTVERIGTGGAAPTWEPAAAEPSEQAVAIPSDGALDELGELMIEADRADRSGARAAARALADAARAERRAAIRAQREAAEDVFHSAIVQAVVGGVAAVAQGVAAAGAAAATSGAGAGAAAGGEATEGLAWHDWVELGAGVLPHATPLLDQPARSAEANRIRSQEHQAAAAALDEGARQADGDAEAARSARGAHTAAWSRAIDLIEQGRAIAIGREAG
jgi:hypothetical protein